MKIILKRDYETLGKIGEIVTVKDGYGRNFLIPKGIAMIATESNMKILEEEKKFQKIREEKGKRQAEILAEELESAKNAIQEFLFHFQIMVGKVLLFVIKPGFVPILNVDSIYESTMGKSVLESLLKNRKNNIFYQEEHRGYRQDIITCVFLL